MPDLDADVAFRVGLDRYPVGTDEPFEAIQEVVWRDTELPSKVVERASKYAVTGDDFEDARLDKKVC